MSVIDLHKNEVRGLSTAGSVLVAVGGGKGGVGKSFLSSNLGIFLANMGFSTYVIDCDLGAPNIHTTLGEPPPALNLHQYLSGQTKDLADCAVSTNFAKLRLISGSNDHMDRANISLEEQSRLLSAIHSLKADFTILDLSAGTHTSTLDFFNMAHRHLITLTPDPTSIENAYRFMRASFYRHIKRYERQLELEQTVLELMSNSDKNGIKVPGDLMSAIVKANPERGGQLKKIMSEFEFELIVNQCRSRKDALVGESIEAVSRRYFGIPCSLLGYLDYDNAVWHALRKRKPLILEFPHSALYSQILAIARDLASPHLKKAVI